jgi:hypothetical protein
MNEILYSLDQIIYKGLCQWLKDLNVPIGYKQLLRGLRGEDVVSNRAYFAKFIENEGRSFLNALHQEINAAFNECERSFFAHEALNVLEQKLERTALLISDHRSDVDLIRDQRLHYCVYQNLMVGSVVDSYHPSRLSADTSAPDANYILQLLKGQLIRLYLEVQEQYKIYLSRNVMTLEDIHRVFFREAVPESSFVVKVGKEAFDEIMVKEPVASYEEKRFEPQMRDTRAAVKGVLAYADIVANKKKFGQLEIELFDRELIDAEYRFKKKPHGNVIKMAAVYWVAYKKGYFQKHYFKEKRRTAVTANDVRLFLNHRYQTNIERQFQNFRKEEVLNDYMEGEGWISIVDKL